MKGSNLEWLLEWFSKECDGDWEHRYGIHIGTLDNPGWYIKINLQETECEGKEFKTKAVERSENDWFHCYVRDGKFQGACGIFNFHEVLQTFREWVES